MNPEEYLTIVRKQAKKFGYNPKSITFATNGKHKFQIETPTGKIVRFGRVGYGDFIIWSYLEWKGEVPRGYASKKRNTFHASHSAIKGNWKSNPYSPNNLALRLLW